MTYQPNNKEQLLTLARELVCSLEDNNEEKSSELISALTESNSPTIFNEIGKLTRGLHEKIRAFESEINFTELDENEIRDAKIRLNYVIEKTSEATEKTLSVVESIIPTVEGVNTDSVKLLQDWNKFIGKEMDAKEFRLLTKRITTYLEEMQKNNILIKNGLNEIIVAQSYQDITGQIIEKVINLVQGVEDSLVQVIKCTSDDSRKTNNKKSNDLEGPCVPGVSTSESLSSQDEVDDLLSSLGF